MCNLQSWTKVLGQIDICSAFSHTPNKFIYTCSAPPPTLQCWTRVHAISPEFQHCIGGWRGKATHFKTDNSAFLKLRFKNTENQCNYTSVPRNFIHHCSPLRRQTLFGIVTQSTSNTDVNHGRGRLHDNPKEHLHKRICVGQLSWSLIAYGLQE